MNSNLTDEELLRNYRADGDNQWLGYLLLRYTTLLFGVAMKYLKNKTQAEDAVQQVFVKVLTSIPKEEILNFKGWLYILTRNYCLQQLRDKTHNTDDTALSCLPAADDDKDYMLLRDKTLQQMETAITELNEQQRKTVVLFYLEKKSYEQIIAETGYTFMQVKSFIQNGKRNLKAILQKKQGELRL